MKLVRGSLSNMTNAQLILIIAAVAIVAGVILILLKAPKTRRLRARFGPEYGRAVTESGSAARGEERLAKLEKRVEGFSIHPLSTSDRSRFVDAWRSVQAKFVDSPDLALQEGDLLVREVMTARGYPVVDFDQQAADLSVNHPSVVEHYRASHEIAGRHSQGQPGPTNFRQGMIHCRELFDDLVGEPEPE